MNKMLYIDAREIENYQKTISKLRNELEETRKKNISLSNEINFLKENGENILVIEKNSDNNIYEYKSTEKELLSLIVSENKEIRNKFDTLLRHKDNLENQKQIILLKYQELKNNIILLNNYITYLENRRLKERIFNIKKNIISTLNIDTIQNQQTIIDNSIKIIYNQDELIKLENDVKKIKKPRGWHFKEEYIDSEGNVYHKGKLQPHLKK